MGKAIRWRKTGIEVGKGEISKRKRQGKRIDGAGPEQMIVWFVHLQTNPCPWSCSPSYIVIKPYTCLLCGCTFYFACVHMNSSLFQVRLASKYIRSKCQQLEWEYESWGLMHLGARNYSEHLKLAGKTHRALCVRFYENSTSGLPSWGMGKEEKAGARPRCSCPSALCVHIDAGANKSPGLASAALRGQLRVHFPYVSVCTHTHLWGMVTGWPSGHSRPALISLATTGGIAPGTQSPPCLATPNSWHGWKDTYL